MSERVLVSGANGFIASHTVRRLLELDYEVTGTVRAPGNEAKTAHLCALPGAEARLKLVAAGLTGEDHFSTYTSDADYVLHMASPYVVNAIDPAREIVKPAVNGTLAMLKACAKSARLKRVIITSSVAAITDEPDHRHTLSEQDWNEKSSLKRNPYYFSKTEAERAAWAFYEKHKPNWDLVVINPFVVIGPSLSPGVNTSNQILVDLVQGVYPAIMDLVFGMVDVRDVAEAHIRAMTSRVANGRYLCAADTIPFRELVDCLRDALDDENHKLPRRGLDNFVGNILAYLLSFTQAKGAGSYLRTHLGRGLRFDNSKIQRDLGLGFRPLKTSLQDTVSDLQYWGHI